MRRLLVFLTCLAALIGSVTYACSFAPGYQTFELHPRAIPLSGDAPAPPSAHVKSIKRGSDDGDFASCSDAAVLTIELADGESDRDIGYLVSLESGWLHDMQLPDEIIAPIELSDGKSGFYFVWLDYGTDISASLKIQSISPTGLEGGSIILDVKSK
jgi:hypothetical protein